MKYTLVWLLSAVLFSACANTKQDGMKYEKAVKKQFENISKIVESADTAKLASFLIYRGENEAERWKRACNYENQEERFFAEEALDHIKNCLGSPPKYKYLSYEFDPESEEGNWYVLVVETTEGGQPRERKFSFLKVNGVYVLADID